MIGVFPKDVFKYILNHCDRIVLCYIRKTCKNVYNLIQHEENLVILMNTCIKGPKLFCNPLFDDKLREWRKKNGWDLCVLIKQIRSSTIKPKIITTKCYSKRETKLNEFIPFGPNLYIYGISITLSMWKQDTLDYYYKRWSKWDDPLIIKLYY